MWVYTRIAYSEGGINEGRPICSIDVAFVFLPFVNTVISIVAWLDMPPNKSTKRKGFAFLFNLKKQK